jgi:hypothetical protein
MIQKGEETLNKQMMTFAAVASLLMGGGALADSMGKTSGDAAKPDSAMQKDPDKTDPRMTGTPPAAETPGVEGKSGSQSGAKPSDKMTPK